MKLPRPLLPPIIAPLGTLLLFLYWMSLPATLAEAKQRQVEVKIEIEVFKQNEWAVLHLPDGETLKVPCRTAPGLCKSGPATVTLARLSVFRDDWVYTAERDIVLVSADQMERTYRSNRIMELVVILVLAAAAVLYWRVADDGAQKTGVVNR